MRSSPLGATAAGLSRVLDTTRRRASLRERHDSPPASRLNGIGRAPIRLGRPCLNTDFARVNGSPILLRSSANAKSPPDVHSRFMSKSSCVAASHLAPRRQQRCSRSSRPCSSRRSRAASGPTHHGEGARRAPEAGRSGGCTSPSGCVCATNDTTESSPSLGEAVTRLVDRAAGRAKGDRRAGRCIELAGVAEKITTHAISVARSADAARRGLGRP